MLKKKTRQEFAEGEFPGPIHLQHPSRVEQIRQKMPAKELKSWFEHMQTKRDPSLYDLRLIYDFGGSSIRFMLSNKRLLMPDGSEKLIQGMAPIKDGLSPPILGGQDTISMVKRVVSSNIRDRDVYRLNIGSSETELVSELVDAQFRYLEKFGVETSGQILKKDNGRFAHNPKVGKASTIIVDIRHIQQDSSGRRYPRLHTLVESPHSEIDDRVLCTYHTHYGFGAERPSYTDIETQSKTGEKTIIIASRLSENDYLLTEWIPQAGKDPYGDLEKFKSQKGAQYVIPSKPDIELFIDSYFEPRRHLLHRDPQGDVHIEPVNFLEKDNGGRILIGGMILGDQDVTLHAKSVTPEFGALNPSFPLGERATLLYRRNQQDMEVQELFVPQTSQRSGWGTAALSILKDRARVEGADSLVSFPNQTEAILKGFLGQNGFNHETTYDAGRFDIYRLPLADLPLY